MKFLIPVYSLASLYLIFSGTAGAVDVTVNGGDCGTLQSLSVTSSAVQVTASGSCSSGGGIGLEANNDGPTSVGASASLSSLMSNDVYLVNETITMEVRQSGSSGSFNGESITTSAGGTVAVDAADGSGDRKTVTYTSPTSYQGSDGFEYRFSQGGVYSTTATVSLTVDSTSGGSCIVGGAIESCLELPLNVNLDSGVDANKKDVYHFKVLSSDSVQGYSVTVVGIVESGGGTAGHQLYVGISETPGQSRFETGDNAACFDGPTEWPVVTFHTGAACVITPGVDYYYTVENVGTSRSGTRVSTNAVN